jgi:hypothetical protein
MKKTLFILFLLLGLYFNYALAENATGTLRFEKKVLIPADRQCLYFEFPDVQIPLTGFFEAQLFTFGPNNRGCQNGCSIQASRYLWTNSAIACFNTSFLPEDSGNWSAYVVYQGQKTNEVRYTVQSSANSTSSALVSNNLNITLDLKANGTTNLSVYPGNMIKHTWYVDGKDANFSQYELVSWYTADKPDSCPGGITKANEPKPWIITPTSYSTGENVAKVEECQAGVNYTITFAYRNRSNGSVVAQTSINVSVGSKNNASGAYNPPSDFCSKIESGKTYSYNQLTQILQPYADSDKASCNLQQKYLYSGIPYSKTGDGSNIPPGVLYKADHYSIYYIGSGDALTPIRTLDGTTFLCSHFDNDLFSSLGFGPYPICSGGSKEFNMIDTCAQPANSTFIKNKIMSLCNKNINVYELSDYLPRELSNINQGSASSASTGQAPGQISGQALGQTSGQATQTNTLNQFRPTDVYVYSGPTTLAGERISTNIQSNNNQNNQTNVSGQGNQTNVSGLNSSSQNNSNTINQVLTSLNSVSSLLKTIEDSNLSEEVKQQLLTLLQSVINSITDVVKKIIGLMSSNNSFDTSNQQSNNTFNQGEGYKILGKLTNVYKARYIKDEITKSGWVAIREMEVYDKDNNKLKIINATSSCDWCGYGTPPSYAVGAKGVFDNNWETVWNAGETAPNCDWYISHLRDDGIYGVGCSPSAVRSAWINVDLGKAYEIGRIRILIMGNSPEKESDLPRTDKISVSEDGINYKTICELKASKENPLIDRGPNGDWIECSIW